MTGGAAGYSKEATLTPHIQCMSYMIGCGDVKEIHDDFAVAMYLEQQTLLVMYHYKFSMSAGTSYRRSAVR